MGRSSDLSAMMSALFLAHVGNSVFSGVQPTLMAAIYFPMSILCFYMIWRDKSAAQSKSWRISEVAIICCSLFGGWPGFYLGQKAFSHKIRKFLFNLLSFVAAGLNIYIYRKVTSFDK